MASTFERLVIPIFGHCNFRSHLTYKDALQNIVIGRFNYNII